MKEWLHLLYDVGMDDIAITAMISIGINKSLSLAVEQDDLELLPKLLEWARIAEQSFYNCIKEAQTK